MKQLIYNLHIVIKISLYKLTKKLQKQKNIIDSTGIVLTPGNGGRDCLGNGNHFNFMGKRIECCCDECDYIIMCLDENDINA